MVKHRGPMSRDRFRRSKAVNVRVGCAAHRALHRMNPYLGLRTRTSFTMFSNLRTEGGQTNHLFMPLSWHFAGWQKDIVQPLASSHMGLDAARDTLLTYFTFHTEVSRITGRFWVRYLRNGEEHLFNSADQPGHQLLQRPSWILRKWLVFRPVDATGPMKCRH